MKWNQELRTMMYRRLLEKYGPHEKWETRQCPKKGEGPEFRSFLEEIADSLRKLTGTDFKDGGPGMQFEWAVTAQASIKEGHAYTFILNKAAAYEAGFITSREMPVQMEVEIPNPWKEN